jgi:hypothetical protein
MINLNIFYYFSTFLVLVVVFLTVAFFVVVVFLTAAVLVTGVFFATLTFAVVIFFATAFLTVLLATVALAIIVVTLAFLLNNIFQVKSTNIATQPKIIIVSGNILNHIHPLTGSNVSCNLVKKYHIS